MRRGTFTSIQGCAGLPAWGSRAICPFSRDRLSLNMPARPEIWLIRHGETEWSVTGQHTGRTDLPLTEAGERHAAAIGRYLSGKRFDLVLTSPLRRARDTARLAGFGEAAQIEPELHEWDYGAYEGLTSA